MSNQTEEFILRMGWDANAVARGTQAMISQQQNAASRITAIWKKEAADRVMMDKEASARIEENERLFEVAAASRRNRARALLRDRAVVQGERTAVINAEIAAGSIPANMIRTAEQKAVDEAKRDVGSSLINGAGFAGGGIAGGGIFHIIMNGWHKSWARMAEGIARALMAGAESAYTILTALPVIGAGAAGIFGNLFMRRQLSQMGGHYGTDQTTRESGAILSNRLTEEINRLQAAGRLSGSQADDLRSQLVGGSYSNITRVQSALRALLPHGFESAKDMSQQNRLDEEHARKMANAVREGLTDSERFTQDMIRQSQIKSEMTRLDKDSVEYKQKQLELDEAILAGQADLKAIAGDKSRMDSEALDLAGKITEQKKKMADSEREFPTIANLAGRSSVARLDSLYGPGGPFDLGTGDGPYAGIAQEYLLAQRQQIWDRTYGYMGAAEGDRQRMISARKQLGDLGVESPAMDMAMMRADIATMVQQLDKLTALGAKGSAGQPLHAVIDE